MKSEFGKGLVVNLVKFYEHWANDSITRIYHSLFYLSKSESERELILSDSPPDNLRYSKDVVADIKYFRDIEMSIYKSEERAISQMITLWANGATDHLYEMEAPKGVEWAKVRSLVDELKDKGLKMGHGFTDTIYTIKDVEELSTLAKDIAILIDKKLGLSPDWGEY